MTSGKDTMMDGFNNNWWNPIDFVLPGSSAIDTLFDSRGMHAAQKQFENQVFLDNSAREFNANEAQKQRDWEEMMSNSQYQRAVKDLKAAGLNPWLAVQQSGMSGNTPSGSSAQASSGSAGMPSNKLAMVAGLIGTAVRMFLTKGK